MVISQITNLRRQQIKPHRWRMLSCLLKSGISLVDALVILQDQAASKREHDLWCHVLRAIRRGCSFFAAINSIGCADALVGSCIRSGEVAGVLAQALNSLAVAQDFKLTVKQKIKMLFFYPLIVLLCTMVVVALFANKILPSLLNMFVGGNASLPASTKLLLTIFGSVKRNFLSGCIVVVFVGVVFVILMRTNIYLNKFLFLLANKFKLLRSYREYVLLDNLSLCLQNGVSLLAAMQVSASTCRNLWFCNVLNTVLSDIEAGQYFSQALRQHNMFSQSLLKTIEIAENTGRMGFMLGQYVEHVRRHLLMMIDAAIKILQPVLMLFTAALVGGAIVAIYMPLFSLGQNL